MSHGEMPVVKSDKRAGDPEDRSDSAFSKEDDSALSTRLGVQQGHHDNFKEQLAESKAHIDKLVKQLQTKDATIAEKDTTIAEKDTEIAEKDITIAEKDTEIAEKDTRLPRRISRLPR